jgi:hypothetical protein
VFVNSRYLSACKRSQAAIVKRWTDLLQIEPGWQYIESDSHCADLMRGILDHLWSVWPLPPVPSSKGTPHAMALPEWNPSRCRLEIILPFLDSGRKALRETLKMAEKGSSAFTANQLVRLDWELLLAFDSIAQQGIEQTCTSCRLGGECMYSGRLAPEGEPQVTPGSGPAIESATDSLRTLKTGISGR